MSTNISNQQTSTNVNKYKQISTTINKFEQPLTVTREIYCNYLRAPIQTQKQQETKTQHNNTLHLIKWNTNKTSLPRKKNKNKKITTIYKH